MEESSGVIYYGGPYRPRKRHAAVQYLAPDMSGRLHYRAEVRSAQLRRDDHQERMGAEMYEWADHLWEEGVKTHDIKCRELAAHFLWDTKARWDGSLIDELAQRIQDEIEAFLAEKDLP